MKIIAAMGRVLRSKSTPAPDRNSLRRDIGLIDRPAPRREWQDYL